MEKKIIFLDIGGVLYCERSENASDGAPIATDPTTWHKFDRTAIDLLKEVMEHTGAEIVLSSDWRMSANIGALEYCFGFPILDITRDHVHGETRGHQISDWLAANPDTGRWAILDDVDNFLPSQAPRVVLTSVRNGFLLGHFDKLLMLLGDGVDKANDDA